MNNEAGPTARGKAILTAEKPLPAAPMLLLRRGKRPTARPAQIQLYQNADALRAATIFRDACIWMTLAITVVSGFMYVQKAVALFRKHSHAGQS